MSLSSNSILKDLEEESIYILRDVAAQCESPVLLFSLGKDSVTLFHLAKKAFAPLAVPFSLLHIDTGYKFPEMYEFRDRFCKENQCELLIYKNTSAEAVSMGPHQGLGACCGLLKTQALLKALEHFQFKTAIGGARRDEEISRSKEKFYSLRGPQGSWDVEQQPPEFFRNFNGQLQEEESLRVFPLSNWTEIDVWRYIQKEDIEVVSLYFAKERPVIPHGSGWVMAGQESKNEKLVSGRFRSLGCLPCTGMVPSKACTIEGIINELSVNRGSERSQRLIDHTSDYAMEEKKAKGYF